MAYLIDRAVLLEIQRTGKYAGKAAYEFQIFGRRTAFTSTTALNDVGEGIGVGATALFPVLAGIEIIQVVSSSANDVILGTGARTIKVTYIDLNYDIITTGDIIVTGVVPANIVVANMLYYLWTEVTSVGSLGAASGILTIRTLLPLVTISQISAGSNRSQDACFMVPDGYTGYLNRWQWSAIANTQDFRLRATVNSHDNSLSTVFHFRSSHSAPANTGGYEELPWLKFPARCKITGTTISSSIAANTRADVSFSIIIIAD